MRFRSRRCEPSVIAIGSAPNPTDKEALKCEHKESICTCPTVLSLPPSFFSHFLPLFSSIERRRVRGNGKRRGRRRRRREEDSDDRTKDLANVSCEQLAASLLDYRSNVIPETEWKMKAWKATGREKNRMHSRAASAREFHRESLSLPRCCAFSSRIPSIPRDPLLWLRCDLWEKNRGGNSHEDTLHRGRIDRLSGLPFPRNVQTRRRHLSVSMVCYVYWFISENVVTILWWRYQWHFFSRLLLPFYRNNNFSSLETFQ